MKFPYYLCLGLGLSVSTSLLFAKPLPSQYSGM